MSLSTRLRSQHAELLSGFLHHEFFQKVADGTLSPVQRDAYFHFEHRFVKQAVTVFGHMLVKAPTYDSQTHIVGILNGLVTEQTDVFRQVFASIGPSPETPWPGAVDRFCDGMTAIVRAGSYPAALAAMLVAESTYADVSERLSRNVIADPSLRIWFDLHTTDSFLRGVDWLKQELDRHQLDEADEAEASEAYRRAVELEIAFHSAPLC
jgi:thiaminase (transcriptional activator TenA)